MNLTNGVYNIKISSNLFTTRSTSPSIFPSASNRTSMLLLGTFSIAMPHLFQRHVTVPRVMVCATSRANLKESHCFRRCLVTMTT